MGLASNHQDDGFTCRHHRPVAWKTRSKAKEQLDNAREEAKKYVVEAQARQAEMLRDAARMKTEIIEQAKE